jgi:hypothetical protein
LQSLFGSKVGEQTALGHADGLGQAPDGQFFQSNLTGKRDGPVGDGLFGLSSLVHDGILSTNVRLLSRGFSLLRFNLLKLL